jgi:hypothetical protein
VDSAKFVESAILSMTTGFGARESAERASDTCSLPLRTYENPTRLSECWTRDRGQVTTSIGSTCPTTTLPMIPPPGSR